MPSYTRNVKRDVVTYVAINSSVFYGFKTKELASLAGISAADLSNELGHMTAAAATSQSGKILILGAQAPKPPRVTKKLATASVGTQQSVSTFCARGKLATAVAANWNITHRGRSVSLRAPTAGKASQTAIAELSDGSLYAFPMNKSDFTSYGELLGLKSAATITTDTERGKLISGTSRPRPGRAILSLDSGGTFTSFFSTDAADNLPGLGFDIVEEEIILSVIAPPSP